MRRIFLSVLAVIVSLAAGYTIICIWRGTSLYEVNLSEENLLRATRLAPSNPDPYYSNSDFFLQRIVPQRSTNSKRR